MVIAILDTIVMAHNVSSSEKAINRQELKCTCAFTFGQDCRGNGKFCSCCERIICTVNPCETQYIQCFKNKEECEFKSTVDKMSCQFKSPCKRTEDAVCAVSNSRNIEGAKYVCKNSIDSISEWNECTSANSASSANFEDSEYQGPCEDTGNDKASLKISICDQTACPDPSLYTEDEIEEFVRIILDKLNEELARKMAKNDSESSQFTMNEICYLRGRACADESDICSETSGHETYHFGVFPVSKFQKICHFTEGLECETQQEVSDNTVCAVCADAESIHTQNIEHAEDSICEEIDKICKRRQPVVLDHQKNCMPHGSCDLTSAKPFKIGDVGVSHEISKWGRCHDIVDNVLYQQDDRMRKMGKLSKETALLDKNDTCVHFRESTVDYLVANVHGHDESCRQTGKKCKREDAKSGHEICNGSSHICRVRSDGVCVTGDDFDDLTRFRNIHTYGCAQLCRRLVKWCHRLSKTWNFVRQNPHIVVHLPSLGYPEDLINRAGSEFDLVSRIAWLENEHCQVLYICPSNETPEIVNVLYDLIKSVRPDISTTRLWVVPIQEESSAGHKKMKRKSRSDDLYYAPRSYRRVRYLTAGRRAFLLPGLMQDIDVCIACELRIPVMGAAPKFQRHFTNKSNVAQFLTENGFGQPPFVTGIRNFHELCKGLASTMLAFPSQKKWLVKINIGFNGYQTAVLHFNKGPIGRAIKVKKHICNCDQESLICLLVKHLPTELQLNKRIYKNHQEFIHDLETYGCIIQGCPAYKYNTLSLGVFIEHDTATPVLKGTADVIQLKSDMRTVVGYSIPQSIISPDILESLAINVGEALRNEQLMGYFGLDVIVFKNQYNIQEVWIVDIDPQYTDLLGYTDWIKFCLGKCNCCCTRRNEAEEKSDGRIMGSISAESTKLISEKRYTVCSGKLYSNGLRRYCIPTLVRLCKQHKVSYDHKTKCGCIVYPNDYERRALSVMSIYPSREMAMKKFIEALRTLHVLSLGKNNGEIETNILKLARDLEKGYGVVEQVT